jgi:methionine synthase II (cobalamin-independent)
MLFTRLGVTPWAGLLVSAALATVIAVVMGAATLRFRGVYFALATVVISLGFERLTRHFVDFTGGDAGFSGPFLGTSLWAMQSRGPVPFLMSYADLINRSLVGRPEDMVVCMHLCRGNFQSAWVAEGSYDPVAELLFNGIDVDGYFLEYDTPRAGNFEPLRFVPKGKTVVLGLVTSKQGTLESKDDLKRRIDEASRFVPLDQLALSPQCGFSSTVEGNLLGIEEQFAKLRLIVEVAREVWG